MRISYVLATCCALGIATAAADAKATAKRLLALDALWRAYSEYHTGSEERALKGVSQALKLDPDLAYANIVRGEFAMRAEDWDTSRVYFERGLKLLKQPDQPLSPVDSVAISPDEVEGDARCFLGYVYIKCAQRAKRSGYEAVEQAYLEAAHGSLEAGLALRPSEEARGIARHLLGMFR